MRYSIPQENMETLQKKMVRIQNKCRKYGCDFRFEIVGEEMRKINKHESIKCAIVEAEGIAIINDWQFVASLEHTEKGNIINKAIEVEVPERYYNSRPVCEHCKTNHARKNTYIVRNVKTNEFKQVGTSCLKDFTFGMNAEAVAKYASALQEIEDAQDFSGGFGYHERYYDRDRFLQYAIEAVNKFGYVKTTDDGRATVYMVTDFIKADIGIARSRYEAESIKEDKNLMEKVGFKHDRPENVETARKAVEWALQQSENSNYMHNLITVCKMDNVGVSNLGILTSLIPVYFKAIERELKLAEKKAEEAKSEWQGNVGEKITAHIVDWRVVASWKNDFGYNTYTYIYKMVDEAGNIYTWKTSKYISDSFEKFNISGKVKAHNEFREAKQTELTRCKVERAA